MNAARPNRRHPHSAAALAAALALAMLLSPALPATAQPAAEDQIKEVGLDPIGFRGPDPRKRFGEIKIQQNLGAQVPMDLSFKDELGNEVRLGDYFDGKPVVLSMVYFGCPMLCTLVLNGMVASFDGQPADFQLGHDYTVLSVSIDPTETPELAAEKKANYLQNVDIAGSCHQLGAIRLTPETTQIRSERLHPPSHP